MPICALLSQSVLLLTPNALPPCSPPNPHPHPSLHIPYHTIPTHTPHHCVYILHTHT
jgi:hypothetical protein